MTAQKIQSIINLINGCKWQEAITELNAEYQKAISEAPTRKLKLYEAVKKSIKANFDKCRPVMNMIQTCPDTKKQFICNMNYFIIFNQYQSELDAFEQASDKSLQVQRLINPIRDAIEMETPSSDDLLIFNNISKFDKIFKPQNREINIVYLFNNYYNTKALSEISRIIDEPHTVEQYKYNFILKSEKFLTKLMACRVTTEEASEKIKARTQEFLQMLKNQ